MNYRTCLLLLATLLLGCAKQTPTSDPAPVVDNQIGSDVAAASNTNEEAPAAMQDKQVSIPPGSGAKIPEARGGLSNSGILNAKVAQGIGLLEGEQYRAFLSLFKTPREVETLKRRGQFEAMVEEFPKQEAPALLAALKSIRGTQPEMSEDKKIASFTPSEKIAGREQVTFVYQDGDWFLPESQAE